MKSKLLTLIAAASISSAALAEGTYVSIDYGRMETDLSVDWSSFSSDAEPSALLAAFGNQFTSNFAVEAQIGLGLSEDEFKDTNGLEIELSQFLAVNLVGILPLNDTFSLYGKAGLVKLEFEDSDSDKYDGTGLSYGVGAKVNVSDSVALKLEYVVLPDTENDEWELDVESNMLSFGAQFQF